MIKFPPPTLGPFSFLAFASFPQNNMKYIYYIIFGFFSLYYVNNILFKDYKSETAVYLTSIGRPDKIPKTASELRIEKYNTQLKLAETFYNVSLLMHRTQVLEEQVGKLIHESSNKENFVSTNTTSLNLNDSHRRLRYIKMI
jgi:hypothetical protein